MRTRILLLSFLGLVLLWPAPESATADQDRWRKKFSRGDLDEVFKSVVRAGQQRDRDALLPLFELGLKTEQPHIAVAVGDAMRLMGSGVLKEKSLKKFLKKQQKSKDLDVQRNFARVLGAYGHPEVDEILGFLASNRRDTDVQAEALFMCGSVIPSDGKYTVYEEIRKSIAGAIKKGRTEDITCAACSAAGRLDLDENAEQLVVIATRSKGEYEGLFAVWALKQMGQTGNLGSFLNTLKSSPKKTTRQACLKGVTELSTIDDVTELLGLSKSGKKDYRDAAVLALARIPWRSWRREKRGVADPKAPAVTGETEKKDPVVKVSLPNPTLRVPDEVIARCIKIVESDDDWEVRDAARQALLRFGEIAKEQVTEAMPGLIHFNDSDASLTGMELCGRFQVKDSTKELIKVAIGDKDPVRRMFAARALEGTDPENAVEELAKGIKPGKRARDRQIQAVRTLGYIRNMKAFDALLQMFEVGEGEGGYSEEMMREAEFAIERLTGHRFGRKPARWKKWLPTAEHPLHPGFQEFDRVENRRAVVEQGLYGLTPATEKAVENGLRWLELQQHTLGIWDGNEKGFGGVTGCEPAYSGLSLLAFLGAGYDQSEGKYRESIRRTTEFLCATQFYDGGYPVTGGGDQSWIYAYLIAMAIWGINESYALSGDELLAEPAQWGIDYLVRVQTPGAGWRYGPRYIQSDTSCTSWVMMTIKTADLSGLNVAQRSYDGIDRWLELASLDVTGEEEVPADLATDYDFEVGSRRYFKSFAGYFSLEGAESSSLQQVSMTAVTMVCRFFQGWQRSHPFMIGCSNYLQDFLPRWMRGLEKGMAIAWYHYYWYYGTLAMHQMGGRYWRSWNEKIKRMYPEKQRQHPPELAGSWDPDTAVLNGGRLFSTAMSILSLESYYRFSPLMNKEEEDKEGEDEPEKNGEDGK